MRKMSIDMSESDSIRLKNLNYVAMKTLPSLKRVNILYAILVGALSFSSIFTIIYRPFPGDNMVFVGLASCAALIAMLISLAANYIIRKMVKAETIPSRRSIAMFNSFIEGYTFSFVDYVLLIGLCISLFGLVIGEVV